MMKFKVAHTLKTDGRYIGEPVSRVDGPAKVSGQAQYAGEFFVEDMLHGRVVNSSIARGKITRIDGSAALQVPGVVHVFTHENRPRQPWFDSRFQDQVAPPGKPFRPLLDETILYNGQPIALVVAESLETAAYAATLVQVEYESEPCETDLVQHLERSHPPTKERGSFEPPKDRGDFQQAWDQADVRLEADYLSVTEYHNPIEMHVSAAFPEQDGELTVYDKTQGVHNTHQYVCQVFGLKEDNVRVLSPFVGGAFGSGLRPQYQLYLAVMAALELQRPVRVALTRQQMFSFGHRPETLQRVRLAANRDGKLLGLSHVCFSETSRFEEYQENVVNWSDKLYHCEHVHLDHRLVELDVYTPLDMRAPGATHGLFALECAIDELAAELQIDPIELRLRNYTEQDQGQQKPFSSKELKECFHQGAERFGWAERNPQPRSMRRGPKLVGWGLACGIWDSMQGKASARAVLTLDGRLTVSSGTADIGTGTYTVMTQIAADLLGLPLEDVTFKLGDSSLPAAPIEGGSWTVASVGSAVKAVCDDLRGKLLKLAQKLPDSPFEGASWDEVEFSRGELRRGNASVSLRQLLRSGGELALSSEIQNIPNYLQQRKYAMNPHSAVFVEVEVDEDYGTVDVTRVVSAVAGGRIINPKTARSQILGSVVWGISAALHEEALIDHRYGRVMNPNLAEYHISVQADVGEIDVLFVEEQDEIVNPLGAKGLGEIGILGVAPAIVNAIYHATGKRLRKLPVHLEELM